MNFCCILDQVFPPRSLARRKIELYGQALLARQKEEERAAVLQVCVGEPALAHAILSLEQEVIDKFVHDHDDPTYAKETAEAIKTLDSLCAANDLGHMLEMLSSGSMQANEVVQEHGITLLYRMVVNDGVGSPVRSALVNANGIVHILLQAGQRFTKRPQLQRAVLAILTLLPFADTSYDDDDDDDDDDNFRYDCDYYDKMGNQRICKSKYSSSPATQRFEYDPTGSRPFLMDSSILALLHEANVLVYMARAIKENWIQIEPCIEGSMEIEQMQRCLARKQVIAIAAIYAPSSSEAATNTYASPSDSTQVRKQYMFLRTCIATLLNDDSVSKDRLCSFLNRFYYINPLSHERFTRAASNLLSSIE